MSVPKRSNEIFISFRLKPEFDQMHDMIKGLYALKDMVTELDFEGNAKLPNHFSFKGCALDRDDGQLYACIQNDDRPNPETDIYLSRIDLSDMVQVIVHNRPKVHTMPPDWQAFMTRLDAVTQEAVKEMEIHTKTVEWVNARDASASVARFRHTA